MTQHTQQAKAGARYRDFVAATIRNRIPVILRNAEEGMDAEAIGALRAIGEAIAADAPMQLDLANWPVPGWDELPTKVSGRRPSEAPFFDFEFWLYARILQAVAFDRTRTDPFRLTKHRDLDRHLGWANEALARTITLADGLRLSLAANAHDLSQITKPGGSHEVGLATLDAIAEITRLDIIADNFGGEFAGDLVLAVVAAERGAEVVLHVKQLPMFVSDTTVDDVAILLDRLDRTSPFGRRLDAAIDIGAIRFASHPFWAAPLFFDRLPADELGSGAGTLSVLKGDLNFRRAIGDVSVPPETPFAALAVLPTAPLLSLRSIKSYCVAGMSDWPAGLPREGFPMDGSIVAAQAIPAR